MKHKYCWESPEP